MYSKLQLYSISPFISEFTGLRIEFRIHFVYHHFYSKLIFFLNYISDVNSLFVANELKFNELYLFEFKQFRKHKTDI